jgi:hypothetical protein
MRTSFKFFLYRFGAFLPLFFAVPAFAQTTAVIKNTAGVHNQICNVFNVMFGILIFVSIIMILWAAYLYLTAKDDEEQVTEAKKAIFYAAIGIVAALLAKGFPLMVAGIFSGAQGVQGC